MTHVETGDNSKWGLSHADSLPYFLCAAFGKDEFFRAVLFSIASPARGKNLFTFPLVGESEIWYDVRVHKEKKP